METPDITGRVTQNSLKGEKISSNESRKARPENKHARAAAGGVQVSGGHEGGSVDG